MPGISLLSFALACLSGWFGIPSAFLIHARWAEATCFALLFLPGSYVALRRWLHRARIVRCDWTVALDR